MASFVNDEQHGFMKRKSTGTNLVTFMNYALANIENFGQVDVIHTDFSKAFDRVNFSLLLKKT